MRTVQTLLADAIVKCGTPAELARRIGTDAQAISGMKAGRRPISPTTVGYLCDVLELEGGEARRLLALAVIEGANDTEKAGVLRRAFFVLLMLGAACGLVTTSASDVQARTDATRVARAGAKNAARCRAIEQSVYTLSRLGALGRALIKPWLHLGSLAGLPRPAPCV